MPSYAAPGFPSRFSQAWVRTWAKYLSAPRVSVRWSSSGVVQTAVGGGRLSCGHRSTTHARARRPECLGYLEFLAVGPPRPAHAKGVRVREATLHGLPPLRRAASPCPRFLGGVPPCRECDQVRQPTRRRAPRRPPSGVGLWSCHPCHASR